MSIAGLHLIVQRMVGFIQPHHCFFYLPERRAGDPAQVGKNDYSTDTAEIQLKKVSKIMLYLSYRISYTVESRDLQFFSAGRPF